MVAKPIPPEIRLFEAQGLNHRSPWTIEDDDALAEQLPQDFDSGGAIVHK
jgi:hypothetical protein